MEDLFDELVESIVEALSDLFADASRSIFEQLIGWVYEMIFSAASFFFSLMNDMGAEIFNYNWIKATVRLFTLFGWGLFVAGIVVAVFDTALQYQQGTNAIRNTILNVIKGFFACSLVGVVPIKLYQFCISLQMSYALDLAKYFGNEFEFGLDMMSYNILMECFSEIKLGVPTLYMLLMQLGFIYCVVKVFFQNLTRGGILLTQIAVGSLYMFNVPRGYTDGFKTWIKQIIAICLTAFLQTTLMYLGMITFLDNMLFGLGIMLSAKEVPRICQQFGLETSYNMGQVISQAFTNVRIINAVGRLVRK